MAAADIAQPSAAVSAPSGSPDSGAPSTPSAPASTPTPAPSEGRREGEGQFEYLRRSISEVKVPDEKKPPLEAPNPATETPKPQAAAPEVKPAEPAKPAAPAEPNPLDKLGPMPAETLAKALQEHPEAEQALAAAGIDKETLFETAREAAVAGQYRDLYPTIEGAKMAHEAAGHFYKLDESLPQVNDVQGLDKFFMEQILPLTVLKDENGQVLKNPDGTFQTDGTLSRLIGLTTTMELATMAQMAEAAGKAGSNEEAERLAAALDVINEFRNNNYKFGGKQSGEMTPEQKATQERLDARERELNQKGQATTQQQHENFETQVITETLKSVEPIIKQFLDATALEPWAKEKAAADIYDEITTRLENNPTFKYEVANHMTHGLTDKALKARVATNTREMKAIVGPSATKVLEKYGVQRISQNKTRLGKIDAQIDSSRMDPTRGTRAPSQATTQLSDEQKHAKAHEAVLAENPNILVGGSNYRQSLIKHLMKLGQTA